MKTVVLVSDFNVLGSGYKGITIGVGTILSERGINVYLIGSDYKGQEHSYPFHIIPVSGMNAYDEIWGYLKNMKELEYSDVLVMADIPLVTRLVTRCADLGIRFSGLFPLEAPPLNPSTAIQLMNLRARFVMSKFGCEAFANAHVPATFVPIPFANRFCEVPTEGKRVELRESVGISGFTFLTVAENQERKNLSAAANIISKVPSAKWVLVTRTKTSVGWQINDLLEYYGITDRTLVIEKGMPDLSLAQLYQCADALLMTSKAEGLGMPVLEAMACGVLVVAPRHTSFEEHLDDGRGILFRNAYQYMDPFGNQFRYFADTDDGAAACRTVMELSREEKCEIATHAKAYVDRRDMVQVGELICQTLEL